MTPIPKPGGTRLQPPGQTHIYHKAKCLWVCRFTCIHICSSVSQKTLEPLNVAMPNFSSNQQNYLEFLQLCCTLAYFLRKQCDIRADVSLILLSLFRAPLVQEIYNYFFYKNALAQLLINPTRLFYVRQPNISSDFPLLHFRTFCRLSMQNKSNLQKANAFVIGCSHGRV